jgi:hypothetical protein
MILENTGRRVDEFFHNMVDLTAHEKGVQEARNWQGDLTDTQPVDDNYLILVRNSFRTEARLRKLALSYSGKCTSPVIVKRASTAGASVAGCPPPIDNT